MSFTQLRLVFLPTLLSCSSRFLSALQVRREILLVFEKLTRAYLFQIKLEIM